MGLELYESCVEQNTSSIFGERKLTDSNIIIIRCINCCGTIINFFKCLDINKSSGNTLNLNVTIFEIPKSMSSFLNSKDMFLLLLRWDIQVFDFDNINDVSKCTSGRKVGVHMYLG